MRWFGSLCHVMPSPPLLLFVNIDNTATPIDMGAHTHSARQPASQPASLVVWTLGEDLLPQVSYVGRSELSLYPPIFLGQSLLTLTACEL